MRNFKRRFLLIAIATLSIAFSHTQAQEKGSHEISLGYGTGTSNQIVDLFSEIVIYPLSAGTVSSSNKKYMGAITLDYDYAIADKLTLGIGLAYEKIEKDILNSSKSKIGKQTNDDMTGVASIKYSYISTSRLRLYSGLGAGYSLDYQHFKSDTNTKDNNKGNTGNFNFQVTALGIRIGGRFGIHAEAGFGYKGIINAGVNYRL